MFINHLLGGEGSEYDEESSDGDELTDEQQLEEGRRMFQVFAAKMFEQRVLAAYRYPFILYSIYLSSLFCILISE
jgi:hypothetical protein